MLNSKIENKQRNSGITLIALVITIIVLLILVNIVLGLTIGENGIFETAKWAEYVNEYETVNERIQIYKAGNYIDQYANKKVELASTVDIGITELELINMYPVSSKYNITSASVSLRQAIRQIEGIRKDDLKDETLVNLYLVDMDEIKEKTKKQYILNIISGKLYSIEHQKRGGNLYHTPRVGVEKNFQEIVTQIEEAGKYEMIVDAGMLVEWDSLVLNYSKYIENSVTIKAYTSEEKDVWKEETLELGNRKAKEEIYNVIAENKTQYLKIEIEVKEINGKYSEIDSILVNFYKFKALPARPEVNVENVEEIENMYVVKTTTNGETKTGTKSGTVTQTITIPEGEGEYIIDLGNTIGAPISEVKITIGETTNTYTITNSNDFRKLPIVAGATVEIETELKEGEGISKLQVLQKETTKANQKVNEIEVEPEMPPEVEVKKWITRASNKYLYNNGGSGYWQKCLINDKEVNSIGILENAEQTKRIRITYQVSENAKDWNTPFTNIQDAGNSTYLKVNVEYQSIEGIEYKDTNNKIEIVLNDGTWTIDFEDNDEEHTLIYRKRVFFANNNKQGTLEIPTYRKIKGDTEFYSWIGKDNTEYMPKDVYTATEDAILVAKYITPIIEIETTDIASEEITLNITTNYTDEMVEKYIYYVSGKEQIEGTSKTPTISDLEAETEYTIYVQAVSKAGKTITSNTLTVTTLKSAIKVDKITLDKKEAIIGLNNSVKTVQISVTSIEPDDAKDKTYKWESLNEDIATVSETGLVTGKAEGIATIRCSSTDGGTYTDCKVTVLNGKTISNRVELEAINNDMSKSKAYTYTLIADIDLSDSKWNPLCGSGFSHFRGVLDGNGHSIKNMTVSGNQHANLAFIRTLSGTVKNLKFVNCIVKNTNKYSDQSYRTGIVFSEIGGNSKLENVAVVGGRLENVGSCSGTIRKRK